MNHILQRKLRPIEPPRASAAGEGEGDDIWSLHLARALRDHLAMPAQVRPGPSDEVDLRSLPAVLPEDAMLLLVETPLGDAGVLAISHSLVAALIEMQTTGEVFDRDREPRRPTRIDAALVMPVIDQALASLATAQQNALPKGAKTPPFICTNHLDDAATVALLLDDMGYHLHRAELRFGDGTRRGTALVALPKIPHDAPKGQKEAPESAARTLADVTGEAQCVLTAVLCKMRLPLETALRFAPGQMLHLGPASLAEITLEGRDGSHAASAKLGQNGGFRALRLTGFAVDVGEAPAHDSAPADTGFNIFAAPPAPGDIAFAPAEEAPSPDDTQEANLSPAPWPQSELDVSALLDAPNAPAEGGFDPNLAAQSDIDIQGFSDAAFAPLDFEPPAAEV